MVEAAAPEQGDKPSTEPEIRRAIDGLVSIHARLILEIADAQRLKWPPPVNAWSDCGALIEAIVELERALVALSPKEPSDG